MLSDNYIAPTAPTTSLHWGDGGSTGSRGGVAWGDSRRVRPATDNQARKLMEEISKHGVVGLATIKAGMDRKTSCHYIAAATLPSQMRAPRD